MVRVLLLAAPGFIIGTAVVYAVFLVAFPHAPFETKMQYVFPGGLVGAVITGFLRYRKRPMQQLPSGDGPQVGSERTHPILREFGWAYLFYHLLAVIALVAAAIPEGGRWRQAQFQLEMLFVVLLYPTFVPAMLVCGGPHSYCTTTLGHAMQIAVFVAAVVGYAAGLHGLGSLVVRRFRRTT